MNDIPPMEVERSEDKIRYRHPAYGTISMTEVSGGRETLFGSSVKHSRRIRISISTAECLREYYSDNIFPGRELLEFELSHAQLAMFITSTGKYVGTPITFRRLPEMTGRQQMVPGIREIEDRATVMQKEVRDSANSGLNRMNKLVSSFAEVAKTGKIGKKAMDEFIHSMTVELQNMPSNMAFAVSQAELALEDAKTAALIDIERAFASSAAAAGVDITQFGIESVITPTLTIEEENNESGT